MVLLPHIVRNVDVPVIAAGGIADGVSMAAAFALGAEGVQMGTRMLASAESVVHRNLKQAVVDARETDTLLLNRQNGQSFRVLRTKTAESIEWSAEGDPISRLLALSADPRSISRDTWRPPSHVWVRSPGGSRRFSQ